MSEKINGTPILSQLGRGLLALSFGLLGACQSKSISPDTISMTTLADQLEREQPTYKNGFLVGAPASTIILENRPTSESVRVAWKNLEPRLSLKVRQNGLVQAADRLEDDGSDSTHYDAVWVRDSLWAYLGLKAGPGSGHAKDVLFRMLDYFSSEPQWNRMDHIIRNPELIRQRDGTMRVLHIRFDGHSPSYQDVQENGKPQKWNHKQNDALGLFYQLILRSLQTGEIPLADLRESHWRTLVYFPVYFQKIHFYEMEDAGSWEEIEKLASSSVGLVTSGLEELLRVLEKESVLTGQLRKWGSYFNQPQAVSVNFVKHLVDHGYQTLRRQIEKGESPSYPKSDPRYREEDAALLNLIYPAHLSKLELPMKVRIFKKLTPLIGEMGVRRYLGDSYQCGNFWLGPAPGDTNDSSSAEKFQERAQRLIPHSEAQWFFDSWISKAYGVLFEESSEDILLRNEIFHLNRALGQMTGLNNKGADGKPVPALSFPESYNIVVLQGHRYFAPSPITPLNWSKASLNLAFEQLYKNLKH